MSTIKTTLSINIFCIAKCFQALVHKEYTVKLNPYKYRKVISYEFLELYFKISRIYLIYLFLFRYILYFLCNICMNYIK